jgi:hypothetical protein
MPVSIPTLAPIAPSRPSLVDSLPAAPSPAPPEDLFYVLTHGGVLGPVTSSELADIAETTFALTGSTVTVTKA